MVFVVSLVVLIAALIGLGAIAFQYISQQRAYDDLEQYASLSDSENMTLADLTVDWDALRAVNPDIVAWVYVPDSLLIILWCKATIMRSISIKPLMGLRGGSHQLVPSF